MNKKDKNTVITPSEFIAKEGLKVRIVERGPFPLLASTFHSQVIALERFGTEVIDSYCASSLDSAFKFDDKSNPVSLAMCNSLLDKVSIKDSIDLILTFNFNMSSLGELEGWLGLKYKDKKYKFKIFSSLEGGFAASPQNHLSLLSHIVRAALLDKPESVLHFTNVQAYVNNENKWQVDHLFHNESDLVAVLDKKDVLVSTYDKLINDKELNLVYATKSDNLHIPATRARLLNNFMEARGIDKYDTLFVISTGMLTELGMSNKEIEAYINSTKNLDVTRIITSGSTFEEIENQILTRGANCEFTHYVPESAMRENFVSDKEDSFKYLEYGCAASVVVLNDKFEFVTISSENE